MLSRRPPLSLDTVSVFSSSFEDMTRTHITLKSAARGVGDFFVGGRNCCCCVPIRFGALFFSGFITLATAVLTIIIFFLVDTNHAFSQRNRAAFIVGGVFQILLCIASILGLVGAIARKFSFVLVFSIMLYVDLLVNIGAGTFVMTHIDRKTSKAIPVLCYAAIRDPGGQKQCSGTLKIVRGTLIGVIVSIILLETYVALVVTRYVRMLHRAHKQQIENTQPNLTNLPSASSWSDDDVVRIMKSDQRPSYVLIVQQTIEHFPLAPQLMEEKVPLV